MAKRSHTDVEAAEGVSHPDVASGVKTKKRKTKEIEGTHANHVASKPPKEERRELKRSRKHEKDAQSKESGANGLGSSGVAGMVDKDAEKAPRKAKNVRLRSTKNVAALDKDRKNTDQEAPVEEKEHPKNGDETEVVDKAAAKAARKAEKNRLKAAKEWALSEENGVSTLKHNAKDPDKEDRLDGYEDEVVDKAAANAARKAERKRLRELGNPIRDKQNGDAKSAQETLSDVPEKSISKLNTVHRVSSHYTEDPALTAFPQSEIDSFLSEHFITIKDPSTSNTLRPITSFSHLPESADATPFATFKAPTPIQSAAWPFLLSGRDVIGVAETGSGKTLAFGLPCIRALANLPRSKKSKGPVARAVIVSPTRELAVQIHDHIVALAIPAGLKSVCVYGGVPKPPQIAALRTAHIVIATPGRLNDLISACSADLSGVQYLVLDEADRMLDKGFEEEIRKIISCCPGTDKGRQTAMFTATWPPSVRDLAATFMRDPVHVSIGDNHHGELRANARIEQRVEVVDPRGKEQRLLQVLKQHQSGKSKDDRVLVFCLYKKEATRVEGFLRSKGMRVAGIHGDMSQESRSRSLMNFKSGACPLLVGTDVAARGLDIPSVKLVVNCTFPLTVEDYVHRIGRYVSQIISPYLYKEPSITSITGQEEQVKRV